MKTHLLTLLVFAFMMNANATVYTVNNEVGFTADYITVQQAVNAASAGDTIYVQPSSVTYTAFNLNKQLFLISAGHNPEFSPYTATLSQITFQDGSSSSVIKGFYLQYFTTTASTVISNLVFSGCQFGSFALSSTATHNNWIMEGNIYYVYGTNGLSFAYMGANFVFRNNLMYKVQDSGYMMASIPAGTVLDHNVFLFSSNIALTGLIYGSGLNTMLTNNIIYSTNSIANGALQTNCSCTWENNLTYNPNQSFANLPGTNLNNTDPEFVNVPTVAINYDYDYSIAETSLGSDAGTDGDDVGLYGGIFNFSLFGFDGGTPRIGTFTLQSSSAPQGGTITINLKAHGSGQ